MKCKICGQNIGMVYSRQIYLERRPCDNFCVDCFDKLMIEYDKLIERIKLECAITKLPDEYDGFGFQDPCHNVDHPEG